MNTHANIPRRYATDDLAQPFAALRSAAAAVWNPLNSLLEWFGELGMFIWQILRSTFAAPSKASNYSASSTKSALNPCQWWRWPAPQSALS
jgi:hypothetical protein